jgi:release factor glutamine methyltransferase
MPVTIRELRVQADDALIAHELGVSKAWLRAHEDAPVDPDRVERVRAAAARHAAGEPLAYILGSAGFYRREFLVDSRVLIPRPETEHLCEAAIAFLQTLEAPRVLDVGTGSGAVACTIAAEVPHAHVDAVDNSAAALEVAAENRKRLHLEHRVAFYYGDLLEPVAGKHYDAIIANLPYVPEGDGDHALRFEPVGALYSGPDGLDAYRRFFAQAPAAVSPGGMVLAEGAPPVAEGLLALAQEAFPGARVTLERDYGGRDRFVRVKTSKVETPGESE